MLGATKYLPIEPSVKTWAICLGLATLALAASDEWFTRGRARPQARFLLVAAVCVGVAVYAVLAFFYVGLHWCGDATDNPVCGLSDATVGVLTLAPPALVATAGAVTLRRETPLVLALATAASLATSAAYAFLPAG